MSLNKSESNLNKNSILDNMSSINDTVSKASRSSRKSKGNGKTNEYIASEEISLSQLEVMANKKKIKKNSEKSIDNKYDKKSDISRSYKKLEQSSTSYSSSSSDSLTRDVDKEKRKERAVLRENRNDYIRREKSELLYKFSKLNVKGKWSSLQLNMNNSLDEIKNEYERVKNEIQNERSVAFLKRMLLLGVQGVEMMNTRFDPLGVDLDGWSESMGYSLENQEYDEVLAELYEKYKGAGNMSPEVRLIFMIISSATMFTITKKITKLDSSNSFVNMIGNMMGNKSTQPQNPPQMYQQQPPQVYQQQTPQTYYQPQQQQQFYQPEPIIPNIADLQYNKRATMTETSDDNMPSKLKGPNNNVINNDGIDIDNILKTMNERKKEKKEEQSEMSEDLFKNINVASQKRGRGRPRKGVTLNR